MTLKEMIVTQIDKLSLYILYFVGISYCKIIPYDRGIL
jgi:hypothetical protein